MEDIVQGYYVNGSLPSDFGSNDKDWKELSMHLLKGVFPEKEIKVLDKGYVRLNWVSPFPIGKYKSSYGIVESARVSMGKSLTSFEKDKKLIEYLDAHHHDTPKEHVVISLTIKCPLFVRNQIIRHRTFSYNEISARYTPVQEEFHIPDELRKQASTNKQSSVGQMDNQEIWIGKMKGIYTQAYNLYKDMLDMGICREQARMVLPQAMYTEFRMTGNLRNWKHFLELRLAQDAQKETRLFAEAIDSIIKEYTI